MSSREMLWDCVKPHFSSLFHPLFFFYRALIFLAWIITVMLAKWWFSNSIFPSTFLSGLSKIQKSFLFSLFIRSFIYISVDSNCCFIQWVLICEYHSFETQNLAYLGTPSSWYLCPFDISLNPLSTLNISGPARRLICFFLPKSCNWLFLQWILVPFSGKWYLEARSRCQVCSLLLGCQGSGPSQWTELG